MDELQFQTQMAKDTDEAAEYYRRLLLEARGERDAAIADARNATRLMDILGHYSNVIFAGDDREIAVALLDKYLETASSASL